MLGVAAAQLSWAQDYLSLCEDYHFIVSAFTHYHEGLFTIEDQSDTMVKFRPVDKTELLYDLADGEQHEPEASREPAFELSDLISDVRARGVTDIATLLANKSMRARLMQLITAIIQPSWQLPVAWSYRGTTIEELRQFWAALQLLAHLHSEFAHDDDDHSWGSTLNMSLTNLAEIVANLSGLPGAVVAQCIRWHIYDRQISKSDIALTPFVDTGKEHLVASPELLITSRFERNFYAHLARSDRRAIDQQSHLLEPEMARGLSKALQARGFRTATNVAYVSTLGAGDIDLLVWSPAEKTLLALELKWYVQPGDYREVMNRNEMAEKTLTQQVPKYRAALSEGLATILGRAFPGHRSTLPVRVSTGLVMRNHVGRSALRKSGAWFAPEVAVLDAVKKYTKLAEIVRYLESFAWLPGLDPEKYLSWREVVTPSGFVLSIPGIKPP